jgi:hypothetical protein
MRNHSADMMLFAAKMKTSFPSVAISRFISLPLIEQLMQRHVAFSENTKISVQRHDPFVLLQCKRGANGNSFLADAAEPFADFSLAQEQQHFLLDHSRKQNAFVKTDQLFVGEVLSVEVHGEVFTDGEML